MEMKKNVFESTSPSLLWASVFYALFFLAFMVVLPVTSPKSLIWVVRWFLRSFYPP